MTFLEGIIEIVERYLEPFIGIKDPLTGRVFPGELEGFKHDAHGYRLSHIIAHDTHANIYSAVGTMSGAVYAAKVFIDPMRYRREATCGEALMAGGTHDHVLVPFEFIRTLEYSVVVYPYIRGETLADYVSRVGVLPAGEAATIVSQVLDGLDYMHTHGVIHRDVKLENIMLHICNHELDFITGEFIHPKQGHVKAVLHDYDVSYHESVSELDGGLFFGTPSYMAPEVWYGDNRDPRSDVYSAGVLFYHLLTGGFPFTNNSSVTIAMQHIMTPPPTILTADRVLSHHLTEIIHKSMAKNPDYRYQGAAEMRDHLRWVFGLG